MNPPFNLRKPNDEDDKDILLLSFEETRLKIEKLLNKSDLNKELYPGWTIRHLLAHITGWDEATIESLRAHIAGQPPIIPADKGINEFNSRTVKARQNMDYVQVIHEWQSQRKLLRVIIEKMPKDKFVEPLIFPWGIKGTVASLINILREHEEEHAQDITEWLKHPDEPLGKVGY